MADPIAEWMRAGKYLPDVLRDFHDQKDVFKAIHDLQKPAGPMDAVSGAYDLSFVTGQCYVIDRFLWFMARRGYTLQRSRARLPFRDLSADVNAATEKRNAHDMALLDSYIAAAIPVNEGKAGDEGGKAHSKSEYKRRVALGDTTVVPPTGAVQVCSDHDAACAEVPVGLRCKGCPVGVGVPATGEKP